MRSPIVKRTAGSSSGVARDPRRIDIPLRRWPKRRAGNDHAPQGDDTAIAVVVAFSGTVALYMFALPGFSSARPQPPGIEGPHSASIAEHTHHKAGSAGSQCIACHMPRIEQTIADVNVHAHTFRLITPAETDAYKIPNACNVCQSDKSTEWAGAVLKSWRD